MDKDKPAGSSAQPARASTGTLQQSAADKRAAKRSADAARNSAAEAIAAAQAETEIMAWQHWQASSGGKCSTKKDIPASVAQLCYKTSENAKMQRKTSELEAQLAERLRQPR